MSFSFARKTRQFQAHFVDCFSSNNLTTNSRMKVTCGRVIEGLTRCGTAFGTGRMKSRWYHLANNTHFSLPPKASSFRHRSGPPRLVHLPGDRCGRVIGKPELLTHTRDAASQRAPFGVCGSLARARPSRACSTQISFVGRRKERK